MFRSSSAPELHRSGESRDESVTAAEIYGWSMVVSGHPWKMF